MSLIIVLRNKSALAPVSDYEYRVQINDYVIEEGTVEGHHRADGWAVLTQKLIDKRGLKWEKSTPKDKTP